MPSGPSKIQIKKMKVKIRTYLLKKGLRSNRETMRNNLNVRDKHLPAFFTAISELADEGKVVGTRGGPGGVVHWLRDEPMASPQEKPESNLWGDVKEVIASYFFPSKRFNNYILEVTACKGRKNTGGIWTRPDISGVVVRTLDFGVQSEVLVITFEVKKSIDDAVMGVYEAAAHLSRADYSYLVVQIKEQMSDLDKLKLARIKHECQSVSVNLITFTQKDDWETYETRIDNFNEKSDRKSQFVEDLFSEEVKMELLKSIRKQSR